MRAEHEGRGTGAGPVEKKVGSPVADIVTVDFATGALQVFSKEPGKGGFRSGGGADAQYLQEKIKVHYTTTVKLNQNPSPPRETSGKHPGRYTVMPSTGRQASSPDALTKYA